MDHLTNDFWNLVQQSKVHVGVLLELLLVLWVVHAVNWFSHYRLNRLGLQPRTVTGLPGIVFSPFLHADANHLFFNCIALFVLANFVMLLGMKAFVVATILIILISGVLLWLFGRRGVHVGASGVIMGYWGFLIISAFSSPSVLTVAIALVTLYYFGGLLFSIVPTKAHESWEGHLFGVVAGLVTYFILPGVMAWLPNAVR